VLLGLLVAWSWAGAALGAAAFLAFLARTPLKLLLVDVWRRRWLARTRLAAQVFVAEAVVAAVLVLAAGATAGWGWVVPVVVAAPLVAIELWFDARSRSRRLVPELCGAVGIAGAAAAIAIAGGAGGTLAAGLWLVLAGRVVASLPLVRHEIARLHRRPAAGAPVAAGAAGGLALAWCALFLSGDLLMGAAAVTLSALVSLALLLRPPMPIARLGVGQMILGLLVVLATAAGAA
jgi:hypothetical protein